MQRPMMHHMTRRGDLMPCHVMNEGQCWNLQKSLVSVRFDYMNKNLYFILYQIALM